MKKGLKIVIGIIIFFTLPSLLLFGFVYLKYNEKLPTGIENEQANVLAERMLDELNYEAYKNTDYIEWTFKRRHHFKWNKAKNTCEVLWKDYKVSLDLGTPSQSEVFKNNVKIEGDDKHQYIEQATKYFNNDSFWLVAPYKVFDPGVTRKIVTLENSKKALLVTYNSGGTTPGDSYLWHLDDSGKPTHFQMWVDVLPINGLEASWNDWTTTETGAVLPTFHKMLVLGIELENIKTTPNDASM
ncbi:hypothetical protein ES677_01215 [Bizionia gelidisalsuginis]|uniref:Uncharacterized protein n=2 Tax=Bizionia TaxID=283785 RepID=A0A8H2QK04_9FLAO|nr:MULTISPECIES: hypothetical protein [Bizionia]TYB77294.1 hypothetical protein ES676_03100 [Bizionia saleffrena]TYC18026.1 hypothetical protein ES677_01215 [Bizionia gelidisalsuginis]